MSAQGIRPAPTMPAAAAPGPDLERQALAALRKMRERLDAVEAARTEPLAIVGAACRLPGAPDIDAFWQLLVQGRDGVVEIPPARLSELTRERATPAAGDPGALRLPRKAGLLPRIDGFDAEFFGITGREAQLMDPQQRIFLEVVWEALERAGIPPLGLKGSRTGVFVGTTISDYLALLSARLAPGELDAYIVSGNTINATAGRVSYTLGLHGPAMAIDTACSSSLVAIDRACRSVREGESRLAIAGGVNIVLAPEIMTSLARWGMLSPDGHCKTFDASADGFVRAEGCGVVLIKKLSDALADGDRVWALVRGSAVNQAGASGAFAVPNGPAQAEVLRSALAASRVTATELGYLEAHGTGTSLGDPIEMEAITDVYGAGRSADRPLWVGAVKSSVGHLEAAAGVTGLIKAVLALRHRRIPPNLHFRQPSAHIPWQAIPVRVPTRVEDFPAHGARRLAAVSAFGFSGTNAHMVLEEAPDENLDPAVLPPPGLLLTLSARSEAALHALASRHADQLEALALRTESTQQTERGAAPASHGWGTNDLPAEISTGTSTGVATGIATGVATGIATYCLATAAARSHLSVRLAVSAPNAAGLAQRLRDALDPGAAGAAAGMARPGHARGRVGIDRPGVAFFFTGQGAQRAGMGRRLAQSSPVFRDTLQRVASVMDPWLDRPLLPLIFGEGAQDPAATGPLIDRTAYTQPALFAIEIALVEWWRSVGVLPAVVLGHSVGEFAAACAAGVLEVEDAAMLVAHRGALMQALPEGGAMAAVRAGESVVRERMAALGAGSGLLAVAGINGPDETIVSGDTAAVSALTDAFGALGVRAERLPVSHAFHSPRMQPMLERFAEVARRITCRPARVPAVSSMTGQPIGADWGTATYWLQQVLAPVRWFDAMRAACALPGMGIALEIGPQPVLTGLGRRSLPEAAAMSWLPSLRRGQDDAAQVMHTLGELYVRGAVDDWSGAAGAAARSRADLPTYPFQHRRYWVDAPAADSAAGQPTARRPPARVDAVHASHPLLGPERPLASGEALFECEAGAASHAWVRDHRILGTSVWPATASVEMLLAAARAVGGVGADGVAGADSGAGGSGGIELRDVRFHMPLRLPEGRPVAIQLLLKRDIEAGVLGAELCYAPHTGQGAHQRWPAFANAQVRLLAGPDDPRPPEGLALVQARCLASVDTGAFHARLAEAGADFGPAFRRLDAVQRGGGEAIARLVPMGPAAIGVSPNHQAWILHPALLDACLQLVSVAQPADEDAHPVQSQSPSTLWVPARIERVCLRAARAADAEQPLWGHARVRAAAQGGSTPTASLVADLQLWAADGTPVAKLDGVLFMRAVAADLAGIDAPSLLRQSVFEWSWRPMEAAMPPRSQQQARWWVAGGGRKSSSVELAIALRAQGQQVDEGAEATPGGVQHIVCLLGLDLPTWETAAADPEAVLAQTTALCDAALQAVRAAALVPEGASAPRLWFVTRGAQAVIGAERADPRTAALWGLARVVRAEHPELHCTLVDTDDGCSGEAVATALLTAGPRESHLALRQGRLSCARIEPWRPPMRDGAPHDVAFAPPKSARIEDLAPTSLAPRAPAAGEVRIDVRAAGLNFRDVLSVLGMVASPVATLGGECAGRIAAIGPGVRGLAVGDEVMALAIGGLATSVCTPAHFVAPRPAGLSATGAAALPIACLTASLGLEELAGLKRGERVLIHAGTGGVGMAAVQLAQCLGAEVYATAGSEAKRARLLAMGVQHVFDSRDVAFARDVRAATGGAGMHVLLNSLAGAFIEAGLGLLEPGGCFLEMGKRGTWSAERVAARFPGVRYRAFDLGDAAAADAGLAPRLFARLLERLARGQLTSLPVAAYPWRDARAAFQTMAHARHIGKLVLWRDASAPPLPCEVRADGAYLVTGGFGTLGLRIAEALAERGARELWLMGRQAPGGAAEARLASLVAQGVKVRRALVDVADATALGQALAELSAECKADSKARLGTDLQADGLPLRGIVHCAGVVDDAVLARQDATRLARVLRPKLAGALNLAVASSGIDLDFLVMFSAGAGWLGNPGQANYAAANAALDALAHTLRARGRPATSIAWGRWAGEGMAAERSDWRALGVGEIAADAGVAAMFALVDHQAASMAVLPMDWPIHLRKVHGEGAPACFDVVAAIGSRGSPAAGSDTPPGAVQALAQLQALPGHERREALQVLLDAQLRRVAGLDGTQAVDPARPLRDLGLDSLMSVELRNALCALFGRPLSATLVFDHPSLTAMVDHLMTTLPGLAEAPTTAHAGHGSAPVIPVAPGPDAARAGARGHDVARLSDEEAEAQLLAELAQGAKR